MIRRTPILTCCVCWLALCLPGRLAAQGSDTSSESVRHMWLLLPQRLVHLEVKISDGGESLEAKRQKFMQQLIARLDTNRDGNLSPSETSKHPLFVQGRKFSGNKFLETLKTRKPFSSSEVELAVERAAGKIITYRQNSLASDQEQAVFKILDADNSGRIDRAEMRTAPARVAQRDQDFDQCITRDEFLETSVSPGFIQPTASEPPESVHSEMLRDASEAIVAQQIMRRFDTDRDKQLSAAEIGWTSEQVKALDKNQNGQLDAIELAKVNTVPADLSLSLDLASQTLSLHTTGGWLADQLEEKSERLLMARQAGSTMQLPLSLQVVDRDVMAEATQNAQTAFNAIDADNNGYLDRQEIAEHQRFERYLFDAMDANEDDRVFASEMQAYVKEYTEPATTTCQVTIFSLGFGVFPMLDDNQDGRISVRELRQLEQALVARSDSSQTIDGNRLGNSYRIEFQRGGVGLFGRVDRPQAQNNNLPTMTTLSGPIWFQRMDRNGDSDLTWEEFLGPRQVFHELDSDGDHLVDAQEASAYQNKLTSP